ncbi:protein of unknown function DUF2431 [Macleaya cordata]|uniref:25S rRNA (uridine-N(3))-methyltransferase BMT5-like domain-containing protein n=1 Tax=Macleaya cordata TaxID=56857 RepID=A0A200Q3S3_MACCD|nr:protein of unknown function DUF2431 [Macleaya cordata]
MAVRWINGYGRPQSILLVGEGDFSFSACLARAFGSAHHKVASSLDNFYFLYTKYGQAMQNINELSSRACKVMYDVDATQMAQDSSLCRDRFDRIIFNFPHANCFQFDSRQTQLRFGLPVRSSQPPVAGEKVVGRRSAGRRRGGCRSPEWRSPVAGRRSDEFVVPYLGGHQEGAEEDRTRTPFVETPWADHSAKPWWLLEVDGEIHVTTKTNEFYSEWGVQELAYECGLQLIEEVDFYVWEYPGYVNKFGKWNTSR